MGSPSLVRLESPNLATILHQSQIRQPLLANYGLTPYLFAIGFKIT
jgi:hypothetical protein